MSSWIVATILMMLVSIVMYSIIRASKKVPIPSELITFAMIAIPLPAYLILSLRETTSYSFEFLHLLVMLIQGIFFVYFGNLCAVKGIELAPNPGFSVLISKIYVIFTAPLSVVLFDAPLPLRSIFAILIIISFSYFVLIEKRTKNTSLVNHPAWVLYTLIAFLCFGGNAIVSKYLLNGGMPISYRLLIPGIFASALYLPGALKKFKKVSHSRTIGIYMLSIALCSVLFNSTMQIAFNQSPNVGFVNAANASSTALLAFTSAYFFKDPLPRRKLIGIIGVLIGTYILFVV